MKQYGMNEATEFTKKQINVLYGMAKRHELKVEKWVMTLMYDLADFYGMDSNKSVEFEERIILRALDAAFENNMEECQEKINFLTEHAFNAMSSKKQGLINRTII